MANQSPDDVLASLSPNAFESAFQKVNRAKHHIGTITTIANQLPTTFYSFRWEPAANRACLFDLTAGVTDQNLEIRELTYIPKKRISQNLAIYIGDAVHNLRSSLDHATTALARAGGSKARDVSFPFGKCRQKFIETAQRGFPKIQSAAPTADFAGFFRDRIKPYSDGNHLLWVVNKLDNIDKHNFIVPVVTIGNIQIVGKLFQRGQIDIRNDIIGGEADKELAIVRSPIHSAQAINQHNVSASLDIRFPPGSFLEGHAVPESLLQMAQTVEQTLTIFEEFAVAHGAPISRTT